MRGNLRRAPVVAVPVWEGPDDLRQLLVPVDELEYHPRNVREGDVGAIAASLTDHGQYRAIATNRPTSHVLTGNHTLRAARSLGWTHIATTWLDVDDDEALRIVLVDNQLSDIATNDQVALSEVLAELAKSPRGLVGTGFTGDDLDQVLADLRADPYGKVGATLDTLRERFVVPPFSVLDGRQGYWRQRKAAWLDTGIAGQEGRAQLERSTVDESGLIDRGKATTGGSVFDPVLCEVAYRWYCPPGGTVLDPFAGGTTRGAVAAMLGYHYTGVELRPEQVDANRAQWVDTPMEGHATGSLQWVVGDSAKLPTRKPPATKTPRPPTMQGQVWAGHPYDMLLTSPPYFDLEPYSSDQLDGSHKPTWPDFLEWYEQLLHRACALLAPNRFAVLVVGEIRDPTGAYRDLVGHTVDAMAMAEFVYFNEAAYITPIGSLPVRTAAQFPTSRKLGKGHQNVLVFYNGDPRAIRKDWPKLGGDAYAQPQEDPLE